MTTIDPIRLEVLKNRFSSLTEEMGAVLMRTAFSPNIKERRDFSCALFDRHGEMIAQAAHIPVHLGSMPLSVAAALEVEDLVPGDMVLLNDPYRGGTHLPDMTLVMPVFFSGGRPDFFLANRAHHADVGGMAAGSLPLSTEIFQEGLRIPPVRVVRGGAVEGDLLKLLLANVRTPEEREGDLTAQVAANRTGERRLKEIVAQVGLEEADRYCQALLDYGERMMSEVIAGIPDGEYAYEDRLDDDGVSDEPVAVRCRMEIRGGRARVDFTESGEQARGCLNAVRAITLSAVAYVFRLLAPEEVPDNAGCMRPVEVITRPGTVADCTFPAAVAGGNVETSQRLVDVLLGALSRALPGRIPAASCGSMSNLTIGGDDPGRGTLFAYYETIAGGAGGGPEGPGASGIQTHMTNTLNTPVEALEHAYPLRVRRYKLRKGSGGAGRHAGGEGVIRELELLADARVSVLSERRTSSPYGLQGGAPGGRGRNLLRRGAEETELPGKFTLEGRRGDRLVIETPGGGGWGEPEQPKEVVLPKRGLRDFLDRIDASGELRRVAAEVDPELEIAAITERVGRSVGPALRFDRVAGHRFAVLTNLFGTAGRMARALGVERLEELTSRLAAALPEGQSAEESLGLLTARFSAEMAASAPCREAKEDSLCVLPALKSWPGDGGRFLTLPLVFTRDAETGAGNCGIYRMQILDGRRAALHWHPGAGAAAHWETWRRRGEPMPMAVALGGDPALICAAAAPLPSGIEETAFAGFLRGSPLSMTPGLESALSVPAEAEFVLEGYVDPQETAAEGPFGNHTGHYASASPRPVFRLTSLTRRRDALFPATLVGPPPMENVWIAKAIERLFLPLLRLDFPQIVDIEMPLTTIFHRCALVKVRNLPAGAAKELIRSLWRFPLFRSSRLLVLLDQTADLKNYPDCYWRIVNRLDAGRDLVVEGRKIGIDATTPLPGPPVALDEATRRLIETRWEEYGID